ncbi:MAG: FAD:protein FMN transferase [bacterium]
MIIRSIRWLFLFLASFMLITCGAPQQEYSYTNFLFGAPCTIKFYYIGDERAREIIDVIDLELTRLDSLLNYFSEISLVTELNRNSSVQAPGDVIFLFNASDSVSRLTDGLFDITVAPLLETWGFYRREKTLPTQDAIAQAMKLVDYRRIRITDDSIIVDSGMKIDLGGIAQGFAADRAALILRQRHVKSAIIDIGGEVLAIGRSPQGRPWRVGIQNPRGKGIIETIELENSAVSTSGDYEKFFIIDNKRYPHIINPKTGRPAQNFASVTILADNATYADAMSTAIAIMGPASAIDFLDSLEITGIIYYEENDSLKRVSIR